MSKPKVTYIISKIDKAVAFEWIVEELNLDFDFEFILLNKNFETPLVSFLKEKNIKFKRYHLSGKLSLLTLFFKLLFRLIKTKPDAVHTHLFEASVLGLSAAKLAGVSKRVYTRHHSTYHHDFFQKAVKYDLWINKIATHIIAISNNVKEVLIKKESVNPSKVYLIEHGFRLEEFNQVENERIKKLKIKYKIPENAVVVGSIARYIEWKGVEYIIKGVCEALKVTPSIHLFIANAGGPYNSVIQKELKRLPKFNYTEVAFENDLFALYRLFDIFVHCPVDSKIEAFGQTYVEALASGIPSIFTLSGIANDFIVDQENALVVDYRSSEQITEALLKLINDNKLQDKLRINGLNSVQRFNIIGFTTKLKDLYLTFS